MRCVVVGDSVVVVGVVILVGVAVVNTSIGVVVLA